MTTNQHLISSEWVPLQIARKAAIWFASLAANVGTGFQNVGGVWLMTRFTASPLLITFMQTATTLPVFLVGLPAGALADIVNRRRLLLATQGLILVSAAALSVLTWASFINAPLLLGFTFVLGLGAILGNPALQAVNARKRRRLRLVRGRDPASEERHVEAFMAESWLDYLRQLDRMTNEDHATLDHARSFHLGSAPPTVTSFIGERPNWQADPDKVG